MTDHDTLTARKSTGSWFYAFAFMAVLIGGCELYKHSTWRDPVDVELRDGRHQQGKIRWGWHDELHIKTGTGEVVTRDMAIITFPPRHDPLQRS